MKKYISLILASILIFSISLHETFLHNWKGIEWLDYLRFSLIIAPLVFILWLIFVDKKLDVSKHLKKYPVLIAGYYFFCLSVIFMTNSYSNSSFHFGFRTSVMLLFFLLGTFITNLIISKIESSKLSIKIKATLFFSGIFIPICSELLTTLVFTQHYLYSSEGFFSTALFHWMNHAGFVCFYLGDSLILWLKSGALFMSITLYEGLFILYLKSRSINNPTD